jgi:hypothetical protein
LRNKRKPAAGEGIPIVTYSRLPKDRDQPDDGPHAVRDAEPWLDGVEVPLVERKTRARVAPDIRADTDDERAAGYSEPPVAAAADLFEPKRRRSPVLTYVAVIAVVAVVAAFGVLAMTFHAATTLTAEGPAAAKDPQVEIADLQKQIDALANSTGPASEETQSKIAELEARLADLEAAKAPAAAAAPADRAPVVRTISTDGAPAAPEAVPPTPRERPLKAEAAAAPAPVEKPAKVLELVAPITSVAKTPFDRIEAKPTEGRGKAAVPASDADFIANIEKALADAPADRAPAADPAAASAVPPAAAPGAIDPADEEPAGLAPPDAASADALPSDIGPAIRAVPRGRLPVDGRPARADAAPLVIAPQAAAPAAVDPGAIDPAPDSLDQAPDGAFDISPQPGTPIPPEPIPNGQ